MTIYSDTDEIEKGKYATIVADPAWSFSTYSSKGKDRSPEKHYGCMTLDEIKDVPVQSFAAKDAVLLLWAIDPMLPQALDTMRAWGFEYKTVCFTWAKLNKAYANPSGAIYERDFFTGLGYYARKNPEMCLLGTRGKPKRTARDVKQLIVTSRRAHSQKPDEMFRRTERLFPGPYLELWSRTERSGWDCWGNEAGKFVDETVELSDRID